MLFLKSFEINHTYYSFPRIIDKFLVLIDLRQLLALIFLSPLFCYSQFNYRWHDSIPVIDNGTELKMAWAGGINAAQYNTIDLNSDGIEDLVIFDRTSNAIKTYLAIDGTYSYQPKYEILFPKGLNNWVLLKDYNCDGKKDIFTSSPLGITTYLNITDNSLEWVKDVDPVTTQGTNGVINLKINGDDLPAIIDADGDGDLDILTFGFTGSGFIQYHQNLSVENTGRCGIDFVRVTNEWGNFQECNCGVFAYGEEPCPSGGRSEHVGGKSLLAFDPDGDGDLDLLIGEENCDELHLLRNSGTLTDPQITSSELFTSASPVSIHHYPAAYLEDVTFDDITDLLISTNMAYNSTNSMTYTETSWLYNNNGTNTVPVFEFSQSDFLQSEMLDFGEFAVPAFFDVDGDSDLDLIIANRGNDLAEGYYSQLYYYQNIGSIDSPIFEFKESDFLGISELKLSQVKIQFADIDGNNTLDLIISGVPESGFGSTISYLSNSSVSGLSVVGTAIQLSDLTLNPSDTPYFYDVNKDGFADLLLGKIDGSLAYYPHNGSAQNIQFSLIQESFYGITSSFSNRNLIVAVGDLNNDSHDDMITTDATGELTVYSNFLEHINSPLPGIKRNFYYSLIDEIDIASLGNWNYPIITDLENSGTPFIVLGTREGGIRLLKNINSAPPQKEATSILTIYPNPGSERINNGIIQIEASEEIAIEIINILGKRIYSIPKLSQNEIAYLELKNLRPGLYIAIANKNGKKVGAERFVVID